MSSGPAPLPPPRPPVDWPAAGTGTGSGWHGPGTVTDPDAGWSVSEQAGGGEAVHRPSADQSAFGPATAPVPQPRAVNRRIVRSVLIGAAAVAVTATLVLTLVVDGGDEDDPSSAAASPSPEASFSQQSDPYASQEPSFTEDPSPTAESSPSLPAGYELYEDEEGFRIAIPLGWTRASVDSQYGIAVVNYRSADGERRLQVYQVAEESPAASFELYLSDETPKAPGFRELDLQTLDDGEFTGSRLEYLADSIKGEPDVGTWHVYDERFVAADGNIYAIAAYGPDADGRDDELELLDTALEGFCPPYACDPASVD